MPDAEKFRLPLLPDDESDLGRKAFRACAKGEVLFYFTTTEQTYFHLNSNRMDLHQIYRITDQRIYIYTEILIM